MILLDNLEDKLMISTSGDIDLYVSYIEGKNINPNKKIFNIDANNSQLILENEGFLIKVNCIIICTKESASFTLALSTNTNSACLYRMESIPANSTYIINLENKQNSIG